MDAQKVKDRVQLIKVLARLEDESWPKERLKLLDELIDEAVAKGKK